MKRILFSIATVSLFFTAFSCSNENSGNVTTVENNISETESLNSDEAVSGKTIHLTKQEFLDKVMNYEKNKTEWVYEGDLPALIDFYADWCGPCRKAAPVLDELAEEYKGRILIYKIDTEKEKELSSVFGIQSIPAFLFIPQEGRPTMSNGIAQTHEETKEMFRKMINEILLGEKSDS